MRKNDAGFALVTALIMVVVLGALVSAYFFTTMIELSSTESAADSVSGFYAAEAGVNIRAQEVRATFEGYNRPTGTSPDEEAPCTQGNTGSGDFRCQDYELLSRIASTYVIDATDYEDGDPPLETISSGDFAGLLGQTYLYRAISEARKANEDRPEAVLEMQFRSRLVPMFQFAAFYNKDLEILPGPTMTLDGRVHVNGDLYLSAGNLLDINGRITVARNESSGRTDAGGRLFRRRKDNNRCEGTVRVDDGDSATNPNPAVPCSGQVTNLDPWNGEIRTGLEQVTVPEPEEFGIDGQYWQLADLRVVLNLHRTTPRIEVRTVNNMYQSAESERLTTSCLAENPDPAARAYENTNAGALDAGNVYAAEWSNRFYDNREQQTITMLEIDARAVLECLDQNSSMNFPDIDTTSEGGLVWYLTVDGPRSNNSQSRYGVRVRNGEALSAISSGAPDIRGLTIVTDQAVYIQGNYNGRPGQPDSEWRPASFLADSLNILSNAWSRDREPNGNPRSWGNRHASDTWINAAFLSGTDTTGNIEGSGGQGGGYNGGLENYPRFHEQWSGRTLRYRGSFVSLQQPQRVTGQWSFGSPVYTAPNRDWNYETRFNVADNLPPLSPRFVYLQQQLFSRDYQR